MKTNLKHHTFLYVIIVLISCGVPNQSTLTGTYDGKDFILEGRIDMLSRGGIFNECAQGVSFYPAYPLGDQLSFTFGFKKKDMYEGFTEQINKNLLLKSKNQIHDFYILGYTNKEIEIKIGNAVEGDFFIIENVELKDGRLKKHSFENIGQAVVIQGKMKLHFDEILIESDFEFTLGQCF